MAVDQRKRCLNHGDLGLECAVSCGSKRGIYEGNGRDHCSGTSNKLELKLLVKPFQAL
jgi:hypothetical protein